MSIEAMKQVVKEAVYHRGGYWIVPEKDFSSLCQAIAEAEKQEQGDPVARQKYGVSPCARHCEANAFQIEIKNLKGDIERAILAEREACLKICEEQAVTAYWEGADVCVEEIKKRNFKI